MPKPQRCPTLAVLALAVAVATCVSASGVRAEGAGLPLSKCLDAVGTFLTINDAKDDGKKFASRSLISLTNGGHAFFTDSGDAGGPGFGPFSDGRGAWSCVSDEDGATRFLATILDFTFVTPSFPEQKIGRLDLEGSFDAATEKLLGTMTLSLVPIDGNPLDKSALKEVVTATFEGQKVDAP